MDMHKGHHLGHPSDRATRERSLRRIERQHLNNLAKKLNKTTKRKKNKKKVAKKSRSGGTRKGAALRPHELWGPPVTQTKTP